MAEVATNYDQTSSQDAQADKASGQSAQAADIDLGDIDLAEPDAVDKINQRVSEQIKGLKQNRQKVFEQNAKLRERLSAFEDVTPDELQELREFREKAEQERQRAEQEKLNANQELKQAHEKWQRETAQQIEKVQTEAQTQLKQLQEENERLRNSVIDDRLKVALANVGVTKESLLKGAYRILRDQIKFDDENQPVYVLDEYSSVPLKEGVLKWSQTDEAKDYISAQVNGGGGATTTGPRRNGITNPWAKDSWNLTQQGQLIRTNPELAKSLQNAAGK